MVTAPAVNTWDVQAIAAAAFDALRLTAGVDPDSDQVEAAAVAATGLVDAELDRTEAASFVADPVLNAAAVQVTVELYRRKDVPFGSGGAWSPNEQPWIVDGDPLNGVRAMILPAKARWGIG